MKGLGTDEDAIVEIIPVRSNAERQAIKKRYKELYKQVDTRSVFKDALEKLCDEFSASCISSYYVSSTWVYELNDRFIKCKMTMLVKK